MHLYALCASEFRYSPGFVRLPQDPQNLDLGLYIWCAAFFTYVWSMSGGTIFHRKRAASAFKPSDRDLSRDTIKSTFPIGSSNKTSDTLANYSDNRCPNRPISCPNFSGKPRYDIGSRRAKFTFFLRGAGAPGHCQIDFPR